MSDSETSEFSGSGTEDDLRDQEDIPDGSDEEWSDFEDEADAAVEDVTREAGTKEIDVSKMVLCKKHKPGSMVPQSCTTCATAVSLFKDKAIIEKIVLNSSSSRSTLVSRYNGRCDAADPTLVLSDDTIQNALNIFTKGVFKDQRQWTQVIKDYLCLPADQHELLNIDIQNEEILNKFKKEPRFQNLFKYGSEIAKGLKHLRLSQRPLFKLMEIVNNDMIALRELAEHIGLMFPDVENAPPRTGVNVPRNGRKILDSLKYAIFEGIFPVPDLSEFNDELSMQSIWSLSELLDSYRKNVVKQFMRMFDLFASHLNASDDLLIFYSVSFKFHTELINN